LDTVKAALATVSAVALAVGGSAASEPDQRPSIALAGTEPLVIKGKHFKPGERVSVQVLAPVRAGRNVVASRRGAFVARFRLSVGRCERVSVHAFGSRRSRARLLPERELGYCPPSR
jgi:hypothetical protein